MTDLARRIATALVEARRADIALPEFPGIVPDTLEDAYAIQLAAIALFGEPIGGWKVGRLSPALCDRFGFDRFIGPVFASSIEDEVPGQERSFRMFAGGSAAFEAEFVIFVEAVAGGAALPGRTTTGIEVATSPVTALPSLGSLASIADLGNNGGQILGQAIARDLLDTPDTLACTTQVGVALPVRRTAADLPGGPLAAFAFAQEQAQPLRVIEVRIYS